MSQVNAGEGAPGFTPAPIVLLVEDSDADYECTVRAARKAGIAQPIVRCSDGDEALEMLFEHGRHAGGQSTLPGIVLLDLNLPGTGGDEVLTAIKSDERLKSIPVTVLSSSSNFDDICRSYRHGANCYVVKPDSFQDFRTAIERLLKFWLTITELPPTRPV